MFVISGPRGHRQAHLPNHLSGWGSTSLVWKLRFSNLSSRRGCSSAMLLFSKSEATVIHHWALSHSFFSWHRLPFCHQFDQKAKVMCIQKGPLISAAASGPRAFWSALSTFLRLSFPSTSHYPCRWRYRTSYTKNIFLFPIYMTQTCICKLTQLPHSFFKCCPKY